MADSIISTLQGVKSWLQDQPSGSTLPVKSSRFDTPLVNKLFRLLDQPTLSIADLKKDIQPDSASASGTTTLLGDSDTSVDLTFTQPDGQLVVDVTFALPSGVGWTLIKDLQLEFTDLKGSITADTELDVLSLAFSATIVAGSSRNFKIPVNLQVPSFDGDWMASGSFTQLGNLTQEAVKAIGGNTDLTAILPKDLVDFKHFQLTAFEISFNPSKKTCSYIRAVIAYTNPKGWSFFSDKFKITSVEFDFCVHNVIGCKQSKSFEASLTGNLELAGAAIQVGGLFPDQAVFVQLQPDRSLELSKVLKSLHVPMPNGFPSVAISTLSFMMMVRARSYQFAIAITDPVPIWAKIKLDNFFFNIQANCDQISGDISATGCLSTQFTIGPTTLFLEGNYEGTGISTLYGSVYDLEIDHLISDLADKFSITDLPEFVSNIVLTKTTVFYATDKTFKFYCEATTTIANNDKIKIYVNIEAKNVAGGGYTKSLDAALVIDQQTFKIDVASSSKNKTLAASWDSTGTPMGFNALAAALGIAPPPIPEGLDLGLDHLEFAYSKTASTFLGKAHSVNYGRVSFVALKNDNADGSWIFFFGVATKKTIDMTAIPLIGKPLSELATVQLKDVNAEVSTAPIDKDLTKKIKDLIDSGYPRPSADRMPKGVALGMTLDAGGHAVPLQLVIGGNASADAAGLLTGSPLAWPHPAVLPHVLTGAQTASDDQTLWFNIEKSFGAVAIQKIGLRYEDSRLWALMNASLTAGPVTISTFGLGLGSPLSTFAPKFTLSGADVTVTAGTVAATGGLVGTIDPVDLYGELLLEIEPYSAGALGGFAIVDGAPSFFLYATISGDFGGPPYFFISGFAAGIGLNRALVVPPVSGVATFPLVQWAMGDQTPSSIPGDNVGAQIAQTLGTLSTRGVVAPSVGEYWLAAGIKFSSFEVVNSFALVTVSLGAQFEIDLLGLSALQLPPADPEPIVNVELQLKATIAPAAGYFAIEGQVTSNSYVIAPAAHLTGGFAFCVWFAGEHEGQFLVTVGGYSDKLDVPAYYPSVPRVGLHWQITGDLSVTGQQYFAVTSAAVMAGCAISAVWQSGPVKAWFDVLADFLMIFKPFHYYVAASCQLGCSVRISLLFTHVTLSFHLGVGIEIWGPDFTGQVHVDLSVISFTIHFGASGQQTDTTIGWKRFVNEMLPGGRTRTQAALTASATAPEEGPASVIQAQVSKGLLKTLSTTPGELNYVVDGQAFEMLVSSSVPSKDHTFGANLSLAPDSLQPSRDGKPITPNTNFGVGPAGVGPADFRSTFGLTVTETEGVAFLAIRIIKNVPTAFWQKREFSDKGVPQIDPTGDAVIADVLVGWRLVPTAPAPDHTLPIEKHYLEHTIYATLPADWSAPTLPGAKSFAGETVPATIDGTLARANRPALLAAINRTRLVDVFETVDVAGLADPATDYLTADPALRLLGGTA